MDEIVSEKSAQPGPDLSIESERLRLGSGGFRSYFKIAQLWSLTDQEALELLALKSSTPIERLKLNPAAQIITKERMLRISYLIGIYKGLHICYGEDLPTDGSNSGIGIKSSAAPLRFNTWTAAVWNQCIRSAS